MFKNILIPTDGSVVSLKAIKAGIKLAQSLGAKVTGYYGMPTIVPSLFGDGDHLQHRARKQPAAIAETRA